MKRNATVVLAMTVVLSGVLIGGAIGTADSSASTQNDEHPCPDVEITPDQNTVLQNESTSLAVQIQNRKNRDCFVLVRVFEPYGVNGMRVDGEPPEIPQNNTEMWQSWETLEPRQRLAIPITIEPGSDSGKHVIHVQVKYFDQNNNYTNMWETGTLVVDQCSATCVARGTVQAIMSFLVEYRNAVIALLSLVVAILSLSFATVGAK